MKSIDYIKHYLENWIHFSVLIFAFTLLNSCKEDEFIEEIIPSTCVSGNFAFKSPFLVSSSNIDFTNTSDTITASFTEPVSWTLTLTGQSSGAKRVYKGHTDTLCIIWRGQPGISTLYTSNENVRAELSIPCLEVFTQTIHIVQVADFSSMGNFVSDFDGTGIVDDNVSQNNYIPGWWIAYFAPPASQLTQMEITNSTVPIPQGNYCLSLKGTAGSQSWFSGGVYADIPATIPAGSPSTIYLNAYVRSVNSSTSELDFSLGIKGNPPFTYRVPITWTGWKMVSIKLSDFKDPMNFSLSNTSGFNVIDLSLLSSVGMGQSSQADIDFILFTVNEPLFEE